MTIRLYNRCFIGQLLRYWQLGIRVMRSSCTSCEKAQSSFLTREHGAAAAAQSPSPPPYFFYAHGTETIGLLLSLSLLISALRLPSVSLLVVGCWDLISVIRTWLECLALK